MAERYSRFVSKVVVGQIAETAGFQAVHESAVDVLADLMLRYIAQLGSASHSYAELAGRTDCNVNDLLLTFEDMGIDLDELRKFAAAGQEVPFAHPLPHYPVSKAPSLAPTFVDKKETPPPHVPAFLPAFPDKHTYVQTPAYAGNEQQPRHQRLAADKARRQAEKSLVKLHDRSMPPPPPPKYPPSAKTPGLKLPASMGPPPPRQKHTNPFLAAPLWEEAARSAPAPESALQNNSNFPEQGAQFGDEEEEEDEAGPMEGVTEALADVGGQWADLQAEESRQAASAGSVVPFTLDLAGSMKRKAVSSRLQRDVQDAFATADDDLPTVQPAGRTLSSSKSKKSQRDPSLQHAEQILAAGSDALKMQQQ